MTVLWNDRSTTLIKSTTNTTMSAAIVLGWDFTGRDSAHANGVPWIYVGGTSPTMSISNTETLATVNGQPGRVAGANSNYQLNSLATNYGLQMGTGDCTFAMLVSTPSSLSASSGLSGDIMRVYGSDGTSLPAFAVSSNDNGASGWYFDYVGTTTAFPIGATANTPMYGANTTIAILVVKLAGIVTIYEANVTAGTAPVVRKAAGATATGSLDATNASNVLINYTQSFAVTTALHAVTVWSEALNSTKRTSYGADPYAIQDVPVVAATGVTMSGPATGPTSSASTNFTVGVTPVGGTITGTVVVTPSDASGGGTFSPTTISLTAGSPTGTFTYTAASNGAKTISVTNNGSLTNPSNITYTASSTAATAIAVSGPSGGVTGVASTSYTASANGVITGTVIITPACATGSFSPSTVSISAATPNATFTYTPASTGAKTISFTNNGSLTNQANLTYTVTAPAVTGITLTGPASGAVSNASSNFTVGVTPVGGVISGTVIVTPSDGGAGGAFAPTSVSLTAGSPTGTFTYTAASTGAKTISVSNNGSLSAPATITYTAAAGTVTFTPTLPMARAQSAAQRGGVAVRVSVLHPTTDIPIATIASITINAATAVPPAFSVAGPVSGTSYPVKMTNLADPTDYALFNLTAA